MCMNICGMDSVIVVDSIYKWWCTSWLNLSIMNLYLYL